MTHTGKTLIFSEIVRSHLQAGAKASLLMRLLATPLDEALAPGEQQRLAMAGGPAVVVKVPPSNSSSNIVFLTALRRAKRRLPHQVFPLKLHRKGLVLLLASGQRGTFQREARCLINRLPLVSIRPSDEEHLRTIFSCQLSENIGSQWRWPRGFTLLRRASLLAG